MAALMYSVWANAPADYPGLKAAAQHLRQKYGGPEFEAHVTVLGGFSSTPGEAKARFQSLCRSVPPVTYKITGVGHGNTYFQCVYLTVDPSPQVMEVNKKAQDAFDHKVQDYMPHLSLLYGDLQEEEKQSAKALAEVQYANELNLLEFVVDKLSLYETDVTDKTLRSWKLVAEYPLEGSK